MDNRKKARQYIEEALMSLLRNKGLDEITVSDVVKKAGVCRSSFYRNYLNLDAVIDSYLDKISDEFRTASCQSTDVRSLLVNSFRLIRSKKETFMILHERKMTEKIFHLVYDVALNEIQRLTVLNNRYQPYFFAGASASVLIAWLDNSFEETEDEMAELFIGSLKGYMPL